MAVASVWRKVGRLLIGVALTLGAGFQLAHADTPPSVGLPRAVPGFEEPLIATSPLVAADEAAL
ncbi:hypothetical protein LRH25_32395, partial [Ideonella azotifigens]|uniref:hypothetical protein n=1 Tax=Ideonella azotifigens TaxID=513160 RepID=UPI001E6589CC